MKSLLTVFTVVLLSVGMSSGAAPSSSKRNGAKYVGKAFSERLAERVPATTIPRHLKDAPSPFTCLEATLFNAKAANIIAGIPLSQSQVILGGNTNQPTAMNAECLHLNGGWWKYELCWNRWIRQIHEENGVVQAEYFLGFGKNAKKRDAMSSRPTPYADGLVSLADKISGLDPILPTNKESTFECFSPLSRQTKEAFSIFKERHLQKSTWEFDGYDDNVLVPTAVRGEFTGGTVCDLNGKPRSAEILVVCDPIGVFGGPQHHGEDSMSPVPQPLISFNISEASPCRYQVIIGGPAVCQAMSQKMPTAAAASTTPVSREEAKKTAKTAAVGVKGGAVQLQDVEAEERHTDEMTATPLKEVSEENGDGIPKSKVKRLLDERRRRLANSAQKVKAKRVQQLKEGKRELSTTQSKTSEPQRDADVTDQETPPPSDSDRLSPSAGRTKNAQQEERESIVPPPADDVLEVKFDDDEGEDPRKRALSDEQKALWQQIQAAQAAGDDAEVELLQTELTKSILEVLGYEDFAGGGRQQTHSAPLYNGAGTTQDIADSKLLDSTLLPGDTSGDEEENTFILTL